MATTFRDLKAMLNALSEEQLDQPATVELALNDDIHTLTIDGFTYADETDDLAPDIGYIEASELAVPGGLVNVEEKRELLNELYDKCSSDFDNATASDLKRCHELSCFVLEELGMV